jgi:hypothetical protein
MHLNLADPLLTWGGQFHDKFTSELGWIDEQVVSTLRALEQEYNLMK